MNKLTKRFTLIAALGVAALFNNPNQKLTTAGFSGNFTLDSGWFHAMPTNRSAGEVGANLNKAFANRPANPYAKAALFGLEGIVAWQYETALHELGHANYARNHGDTAVFETGDNNFWKYLASHKLFGTGATYTNNMNQGFGFFAAGMNATTQFAEDHDLDIVFSTPARLSAWFYMLSPQPGDLSDTGHLSSLYSARNMRAAQLLAFAGSLIGKPQWFVYFNNTGMSLRAVDKIGNYTVAVESLLQSKNYNAEVAVSRKFQVGDVAFTPKVTLGKGINVHATAEYKGMLVGVSHYSRKTLSGARIDSSNEIYTQYSIKL